MVDDRLRERRAELGPTTRDVDAWSITGRSTDAKGITYVYIQQEANGLPVQGAVANFALRDGRVVGFGDRLRRDVAGTAGPVAPTLDAVEAFRRAALHLALPTADVSVVRTHDAVHMELAATAAHGPVPARLLYQPTADGRLHLAWRLTIRSAQDAHWWSVAVDAASGAVLRVDDHTLYCDQHAGAFARPYDALDDLVAPPPGGGGAGYRVFAYPVESPSHGARTLVTDPADDVASPFGWHDINGLPGAEFTITRGNNVYAGEDMDNDDFIGYSPDGGASLLFDFPFDPEDLPVHNLDAATTNLFHACNVLHDVWYRYGFDEGSANFQATNYSGEGAPFDDVIAQIQDGGGSNNANFATPPDGSNGRMQMYLYRVSGDSAFWIEQPAALAGTYASPVAGFGPSLPMAPIIEEVVLVEDDTPPINDGCGFVLNPGDVAGRIAMVDRGDCTFIEKVEAMEALGAVAVIVVNNVPGPPIGMGGTGGIGITIPSVMIAQEDGALIKAALLNGAVIVRLQGDGATDQRDSGFDNGIVAHEYGHGVSNRLTGGGTADCLWNDEQMGEGWSDWMAMMMTMRPGDQGNTGRGMGTYTRGQDPDGVGIRPARYTTDMSENGYTFGATNDEALTMPHGVGFVWATMLWDMTWALIGEEGLDTDLHTGDGGNNTAIQLVLDGMKLQPCNPGFVDGRDAILLADELAYDGAHACLIWNAFARRGLGVSADQGSSFDRFDQVEAFDVPAGCVVGITGPDRSGPRALRLMPNPANGQVTVQLDAASAMDATVRILAADGRMVRTATLAAGLTTLLFDVDALASGLYVVELGTPGRTLKERLVLQ